MRMQVLSLLLFILFFQNKIIAQSFEGTWKGTSICQVKNSPCHDEVVVYYITKESNGKTYSMVANKIVNGKEDDMGTLIFSYDDKQKSYISEDNSHSAKWKFKIDGDKMKGTLMVNGNLYRLVDAKKENS